MTFRSVPVQMMRFPRVSVEKADEVPDGVVQTRFWRVPDGR